MSYRYGIGSKPIRVENGTGFIPVVGADGEHEVVVKPDETALEFLRGNASADGADELFKKLLSKWFTTNQGSVDGQDLELA